MVPVDSSHFVNSKSVCSIVDILQQTRLMPPSIFQLQLHTTMSRNLLYVNPTVTGPLARGKSRNFRQVNRDISRKELETKTREEMRQRCVQIMT